ncbi:MAG: hypothetical protein KatS3mg131_3796 [Candidatus Tectimicrobiota bacterium]|nr:MAG: hypothetical protein KatS3mg131_3796 [Candidatus Tectomicrobia bacterium]
MRFADKALLYTATQVLGSVLQIAMGMVMVRYLSKHDYGTFRQIMLLSVLVSNTVAIGIPQSLPYFIPRAASPQARKQLALQVFTVLCLLGALGAGGLYLLRQPLGTAFHNDALPAVAGIWCLYFLFLMPSKCAEETLIALGRITGAALLNLATVVSEFAVVVAALVATQSLYAVLLAMLGLYGLRLLAEFVILLSLEGGWPRLVDWPVLRQQVAYSAPLGLSVLTGVLRSYADKFLISLLYVPETFAVYARGAFELPLVRVLPYTLGGLLIPKIAAAHKAGDTARIIYLWQEKARVVALVFFPLFVFSFLFAEQIVTALFTAAYAESTLIFRIYLCLLPFRIVQYRAILQGVGHTRPIMLATWVALGATVVLSVAFHWLLGFGGPALAMVLGELAGAGFMLWQSKRVLGVKWSDLVPLRQLAAPWWVACGLGLLLVPLASLPLSRLLFLGSTGLLYFVLYVAVLKLLGVLPAPAWELMCRWATLRVWRHREAEEVRAGQ